MGLDAVELVIAVEETFGIAIPDAVAVEMITPALLIKHVQDVVGASTDSRPCISQRAFYQVRADLMKTTGLQRAAITPNTSISTLFPRRSRKVDWEAFRAQSFLRSLPDLRFGRGWLFAPSSVRDLVSSAVAQQADCLTTSRSWSLGEVREVIRHIISEQLGIKHFVDTDEFVRDLGVD